MLVDVRESLALFLRFCHGCLSGLEGGEVRFLSLITEAL
jgi:hypothetical protein